jgi:hypothetical protein
MRIGSNDNYVLLERVGQDGSATLLRIEAATLGADWRFAVVHEQVRLNAADETRQTVADFTAHRLQRFKIMFSEGGWLWGKRDPAGNMLVRYRVGQFSAGAALEGEVVLGVAAGDTFCRKLGALL